MDELGAGGSELGPVSPELALVDPELGRAARKLLPDPPHETPADTQVAAGPAADHSAFVERLRGGLEPVPDLPPPRRRARLGRLASATGFVALVVLGTLLVGRERGSAPPQQPAESVAAEVSPPESTPTATTSRHAPATPGKTFVWAAAPEAASYEFQLFRGRERIFRALVDEPRLDLPGRWRQRGLPHALLPGSYRWYVWPVSRRTKRRSTVAIVQATLVIKPQRQ